MTNTVDSKWSVNEKLNLAIKGFGSHSEQLGKIEASLKIVHI